MSWTKIIFFLALVLPALGGVAAALRLFKGWHGARFAEGGLIIAGMLVHGIMGLILSGDPLYTGVFVAVLVMGMLLGLRSIIGPQWKTPSFVALVVVVVGLVVYEGYLWIHLDRPPFRLLGETFVLLTLFTGFLLVISERLQGIDGLGQFTGVLMVAFMTFTLVWPDLRTKELPPALQSAWFVPHVVVYLLGYGALTLAFVMAVGYLLASKLGSDKADGMGKASYRLVSLGFPFLSAGLLFGCFWGQSAWGSYWGWDPKETWAFITWIVYLVYLHLRFTKGWSKTRAAWLLIAGVVVIFVTYLLVNALPTAGQSVHTYT